MWLPIRKERGEKENPNFLLKIQLRAMTNSDIADIFRQIARILELKGENPFRIRAYEKAAQNIEGLSQSLEEFLKEDRLQTIPGIGKDLAGKIKEILETGTLNQYEELKRSIPEGLIKMLQIPGLGPKTIKLIYNEFKIKDIDSLEKAALSGRLEKVSRIKARTRENILKGIAILKEGKERAPLSVAIEVASSFLEPLKKMKEVSLVEVAGSLRRRKDTVKDIDILVVSSSGQKVMDRFVSLKEVKDILAKGITKSSVISRRNIQVDLRVVEKDSFGSALLYFTGSKSFNISLRQFALKKGYKINEYGLFKLKKGQEEKIAGRNEEEIFKILGMDFIPPVLREDRGEIELALKHNLPRLVTLEDVKGDFHIHSKYSDGANTLEELAQEGSRRGYEYIGVCDHSQSLKVASGLDKREIYRKLEEIRRLNKKLKSIQLLCGTEVDILSDGSLDYSREVLKELDIVIAAIHSGFKQTSRQLTRRIISAIKNKYVHIIAHPTGRLFGVRDSYEIDFSEIFSACRDYHVALEINAYPQRLDLNDINSRRAKMEGVSLALGTDAHILDQMGSINLGVWIAQRAWLEKDNLLNTWSFSKLYKWLREKK